MPNLVYSTMTNGTNYVAWRAEGHQLPRIVKSVAIKGGAGLMTKRVFETPFGVMTEVSDADMVFLETNREFLEHVEKGWIRVVKSRVAPTANVVAADMAQRDGSAPFVPNDFAEGKAPTSGTEKPVTTTKPRNSAPPKIQNDFK